MLKQSSRSLIRFAAPNGYAWWVIELRICPKHQRRQHNDQLESSIDHSHRGINDALASSTGKSPTRLFRVGCNACPANVPNLEGSFNDAVVSRKTTIYTDEIVSVEVEMEGLA